MSYQMALKAAGAEVIEWQEFGTYYHGDWWAKVRYNCQLGWVTGSFGSCPGCDSFEAEFGSDFDEQDSQEKLASFGKVYLERMLSQSEAEAQIKEMLDWIKLQ